MSTSNEDADLIRSLGGPAKVAQELGLSKFGTQRVFNWMRRGIPAEVKLARPDLFLPGWRPPKPSKPPSPLGVGTEEPGTAPSAEVSHGC